MSIKLTHYYFLLAIGICLVIGLPTFFSGCGTNIPNTCFSFIETTGTVYGHKITSGMCKACVKKDENKKCTKYNYYTCYDGYVKIDYYYHNSNKTCLYEPYQDEKYFSDVKDKLDYYYPVNYKNTLYVNKIDNNSCTFNQDGLKALTYVGIVFLTFSLVGIVGLVGLLLFENAAKPIYNIVNNVIQENKDNNHENKDKELSSV